MPRAHRYPSSRSPIWFGFLLLLSASATAETAVTHLRAGWGQQLLYQHTLVNPRSLAIDGDGELLVVSAGNHKLLRLTGGGAFEEYGDLSSISSEITAIAYQPNRDRLLIATAGNTLYGMAAGQLAPLQGGWGYAGSIAVSSADDSFYACSPQRGGAIVHYDAAGDVLATVATGVDGCYQLALDPSGAALYFSETYAGSLSRVDLADNSREVIATGVGIPNSFEPISVAFDGQGRLHYFTIRGLYRYDGGAFVKVMDAISGAGALVWSTTYSAFLQGSGGGSNILRYDPAAGEASHLTDHVNALSLVEWGEDGMLAADFNYPEIRRVGSDGFTTFAAVEGENFNHLARGGDGTLYAGTIDGDIYTIDADGSATRFSSEFGGEAVIGLHFDVENDALVVVTAPLFDEEGMVADWNSARATVWRLSLTGDRGVSQVATFSGTVVHFAHPVATVDEGGNIYLLNYVDNVIYRIANGGGVAEVFRSNVLDSPAINFPSMTYSSREEGLLVGTIENYELWRFDSTTKIEFARIDGSVDNFALDQTADGDILAAHAGRLFRFTAPSATPLPAITANQQGGSVSAAAGAPVSVRVSLIPGARAGETADWWVYADTPFGTFSYVYPTGWLPGEHRTIRLGLIELPSVEVLNLPLPAGAYALHFSVDDNDDGTRDDTWSDRVDLVVQ